MKKRLIAIAVALILIVSFSACANISVSQETAEKQESTQPASNPSPEQISAQTAPEYVNDTAGYGITKLPEAFKSPNFRLLTEYVTDNSAYISLFFMYPNDGYSVDDAMNDEDARRAGACLATMFFSTDKGDILIDTLIEDGVDAENLQELTRNDGNNLFYMLYSGDDLFIKADALTEAEKAAVNDSVSGVTELMKNVVCIDKTLPTLSFTTVDFYGNPITSDECFSSSKVTLLNCWGSFCGPCEAEMPALVQANDILSSEGCQVLLCLYDTDDRNSKQYQDAVGLLERAGATNLKCIMVNDEIKKQLDDLVMAYPTSFPVGSDGKLLGLEYTGDRDPESFTKWVRSYQLP